MHHAPAGPPLSARLTAALARGRSRWLTLAAIVRPGLRFVRRTRLVPVLVAGLVITALALAAPLPAGGQPPTSTAALTAPSDGGRALVPATGDGWTQDGAPTPGSGAAAEDEPARTTDDGTVTDAAGAEDTSPSGGGRAPAPSAAGPEGASAGTSSAGTRSTTAGPSTTSADPATGGRTRTPSSSPRPATSAPSTPSSSVPPSSVPPASVPPASVPSSSVPSPAPGTGVTPVEQVLAAVDAARTAGGCAPLAADAGLTDAATAHSTAMRDAARLLPPPGTGTVADGSSDPAAVAAGWLADPAAPVTDCARTTAGVAVVDGWWTLLLA